MVTEHEEIIDKIKQFGINKKFRGGRTYHCVSQGILSENTRGEQRGSY